MERTLFEFFLEEQPLFFADITPNVDIRDNTGNHILSPFGVTMIRLVEARFVTLPPKTGPS